MDFSNIRIQPTYKQSANTIRKCRQAVSLNLLNPELAEAMFLDLLEAAEQLQVKRLAEIQREKAEAMK